MISIGWMASGAGLFVAIANLILFVPIILLIVIFKIMINDYKPNKRRLNMFKLLVILRSNSRSKCF